MPRVLVTDAGARNVVAAVRSLGRAGLEVYTCEENRIAISSFSKYSKKHLVCPSPKTQPQRWLDWLIDELSHRQYEMLMPMDDETVSISSKNKTLIQKYTRVPVPEFSTLTKARDKAETIKIATEQDLPCPKTFFVKNTEEAKQAAGKLGFPLVIKPRESSGSRGIVYVKSMDELVDSYKRIHSKYPYPMIQEYIPPGGDACGIFLMLNKQSETMAVFSHKRLREFPLSGGPSTLRESVHRPELETLSEKLLKAMGWYGVAMVEFKEDPRDGKFKIMEVNPRFWGSLQLAILSGVDFPSLLYKMEIDGKVEPVMDYEEGVRCRWLLPGDILHFICNPNRFKLKPGFFNFSKNNRQDDFISWRDPGPVLGFFLTLLRDIFNPSKWRHAFKR